MKILQMVQTLDPSTGGVAAAVMSLSKALAARGHEVEIVALDASEARWLADCPLRVHALGEGRTSYRYSAELLPWLREHAGGVDRVIVNGLWQYQSFAAWRAFAGGAVPYYVFPHGMLDPWFKRTYPLKHAKKWLYWPWADYRTLRDARAVIFTCEEERRLARESFWLYRCREMISPLGVEKPEVSSPEEFFAAYPELREKRLVLFLGRLHVKKGPDLLLEAFAKVAARDPSLLLVMAGPDQENWTEQLRNRAAELNVSDRVIFTGMLEGSLKWSALCAAEVFVLPSHQENFGLSVVEALAVGVPVLISNRVNIWREVKADGAGLVETDDVAGTLRLLERWLDAPAETQQRMRSNARQCFASRFEIGRAAESLERVLEA